MTPYVVLAAVVLALMAAGEGTRRHYARERHLSAAEPDRAWGSSWTLFDIAAIAALVTFSAVRYGIGTDYGLYAIIYDSLDTNGWSETIAASPQEAGFTTLMLILKSISSSPFVLFWVTSLLAVVPAYVAIKQVSARPVLAVMLYILLGFYLAPFNLVRQGIAISLVFFAAMCLRRRPAWFVAVGALAFSFHVTSLVALGVILLAHRRRPSLLTLGLIVAATAAGLVMLNRYAGLGELIGRLNPRYELFLESTEGAGVGTFLQLLVFLGLLGYAALLGQQDSTIRAQTGWLVVITLVGVSLMIMSTQALPLGRLALFFTIYLAVLLPERVAASRRPMFHDLVLVAIGLVFYVFYLSFYGGMLPYQTYFS